VPQNPKIAPLGAKPLLPAPSGDSARKGAALFQKMINRPQEAGQRARRPAPPPAPLVEPTHAIVGPACTAEAVGGGRRYDVAMATVAALEGAQEVTAPLPEPLCAEPTPTDTDDEPTAEDDDLPVRPPPGAPTVRPPTRRPAGPAAVPQDVLEKTAQSALLLNSPDGNASFEIAFRDDVFEDLACCISTHDDGLVATFKVADQNLRRLLEAESGRLRVKLEDRGLKVKAVEVEIE